MERRKFPRRDLKGSPIRATVILTGGSLLKDDFPTSIEITTEALNISEGGVCLAAPFQTTWETLSPEKEVDLYLTKAESKDGAKDGEGYAVKGTIRRVEKETELLGMEFKNPFTSHSLLI